jgi:hypothetical protein
MTRPGLLLWESGEQPLEQWYGRIALPYICVQHRGLPFQEPEAGTE